MKLDDELIDATNLLLLGNSIASVELIKDLKELVTIKYGNVSLVDPYSK